jgi:adenylosuccinate lyase
VPAENTVRLLEELVIASNIMANLSHDMRHLQRSEIAEVRERFEKGQTGSSTMAHKRNPWNFENIISMSKQVNSQIINANLNISSEHQRDLTDSASSRFYTITLACVASMAERLNKVMDKLEVDENNMTRNLYLSAGAIAAEPLYLLLEKYGHTTGHEASKEIAHKALSNNQPLHEAIAEDEYLSKYWEKFTEDERSLIISPEENYTGLASKKALKIHDHWRKHLNM